MVYPRVLVIEDHPLMQQTVHALLAGHCTVVGTLDNAEEAPQAILALEPDVLLLDVSLPGRSGMQALPELREGFPDLGIVMMTNHNQPAYRTEALKRGADVFVLKDHLTEQLWLAVQSASERCTLMDSQRSAKA